jgi:hypothetical protein
MRRRSLIATSSTFHLSKSSNHHVGNTACRKLKFRISKIDIWHDMHTKFHEFLSSLSPVIYRPTSHPRAMVRLGLG